MRYAIVEISGRQYKAAPGSVLSVDYLGDMKTFECDKVLVLADDKEFKIGAPYLKEKLLFDVLGNLKKKIRVATYKAKANTRKVKGSKTILTRIKLH